jgi:drug/metabolite transporter (DMT)-like permease
MVLTTLLMATVTAIVRHVGSDLPAAQAGFIRYAAGALIMLPFMGALLRQPAAERKLPLHALRGAFHGAGVILWFYAMARIPIAEVTALGYIVPIFIILGAAIFLGEKLHARRLAAVAVGFLGALIILRPGFQEISLGQLAQVAAGPCYAASYLIAKRLTTTASPTVIVGLLSVFCTLAIMPVALAQWVAPSFDQVAWLCLTAVFATAGHWTMTKAFESAPISVTQPVQFLQLVWATMFGIVLFGEPLDPFVILGGGIVLAAATFISHRESRAAGREAAGKA